MMWRKLLNRLTNNSSVLTYLIELSLIILSILVAIQADRYQQSRQNIKKLDAYMQSVYQDLLDEQETNKMNLVDCGRDMNSIKQCLRLSRYNQDDSLDLALRYIGAVLTRGVFRTFPPTTFDIMLATGDVSLIRDLEFRKDLASNFSFRDRYIKRDLEGWDEETKQIGYYLSKYIDLACLSTSKKPIECLTDRSGFVRDVHNDLLIYLRVAQLRAFHLERAITNTDYTIEEVEARYEVVRPSAENEETLPE